MRPGCVDENYFIRDKSTNEQGNGGNMQLLELNLLKASQYLRLVYFNQINAEIILLPCLEILTSLPCNLSSSGNRTACESVVVCQGRRAVGWVRR
jgi:hypothetical protein